MLIKIQAFIEVERGQLTTKRVPDPLINPEEISVIQRHEHFDGFYRVFLSCGYTCLITEEEKNRIDGICNPFILVKDLPLKDLKPLKLNPGGL